MIIRMSDKYLDIEATATTSRINTKNYRWRRRIRIVGSGRSQCSRPGPYRVTLNNIDCKSANIWNRVTKLCRRTGQEGARVSSHFGFHRLTLMARSGRLR
jgi:hypothetical protein